MPLGRLDSEAKDVDIWAEPGDSGGGGGGNRSRSSSSSSDPESFSIRRQNRLAMPRDWKTAVNRRSSEGPSSHVAVSGIKPQQPQQQLEMDGEWIGDAHGETGSTSEKVGRAYSRHLEILGRVYAFLSPVAALPLDVDRALRLGSYLIGEFVRAEKHCSCSGCLLEGRNRQTSPSTPLSQLMISLQ